VQWEIPGGEQNTDDRYLHNPNALKKVVLEIDDVGNIINIFL
jgi:hypothetical protein